MADNFLRRLFNRSSKDTAVPLAGVRPTLEPQPLRPPGVAGSSVGAEMLEMRVDIGTLSDVGCVREVNEDSIRVIRPTDPNELAKRGILVVVADGMGGHNAGEIASRLAVEAVVERYADETQDPGTALARSIERANRIIVDAAAKDARYTGMGTTCTALLLRGGLAFCAHVGDSRLYFVRGNDILLMTEDHSAVMDMVKRGTITADEARHHPDKHVIVRALGVRGDVEVATWEKPLAVRPGDTFLICSDGLYNVVEDSELFDAMRGLSPQRACKRLVELARQRGGPDNITVGIITVTDSAATSATAAKVVRATEVRP
jgi:PPM family protein phosphatase